MQRNWLSIAMIFIFLHTIQAHADDTVMGARALIDAAKEAVGEEQVSKEKISPIQKKREALAKKTESFRDRESNLPPDQAAKTWLALVDTYLDLPKDPSSMYGYGYQADTFLSKRKQEIHASDVSIHLLVSLIPGPRTWEALDQAVANREDNTPKKQKRNAVLRILVDLLQGQLSETSKNIDDLKDSYNRKNSSIQNSYYGNDVDQRIGPLQEAIQETIGFSSKEEVVQDFKDLVDDPTKLQTEYGQIEIPDLCRLTSKEEARELLRKVIGIEKGTVSVQSGGQTQRLLKDIFLSEIDNTKQPMWNLVTSPKDIALYEAIEKKYPPTKPNQISAGISMFMRGNSVPHDPHEHMRRSARSYYLIGLIANGRIDDARKIVETENGTTRIDSYQLNQMMQGMNQTSFALNLFNFIETLLDDDIESALLQLYPRVAMMAGKTQEAMVRIQKALKNTKADSPFYEVLLQQQCALELASGKVDAGISTLRKLTERPMPDLDRESQSLAYEKEEMFARFIQIGMLLEREDLVDEGMQKMRKHIENSQGEDQLGHMSYRSLAPIEFLIMSERYADAEKLMLENMISVQKTHAANMANASPGSMYGAGAFINLSQQLQVLVQVYDKLDRMEDVLFLLREVPWWGMPVLPLDDPNQAVAAAKALAYANQEQKAINILKNIILKGRATDAAYQLLISLQPEGLVEWFDYVFTRDHFEERPLIWKAVLLKDSGDLNAAEEAIRHALKVDPTDGETGAGQRAIAYSILADILEAKGDEKDAQFFRDVVSSVRTAEKGDAFFQAGLTSKSLELYAEAENDFVDAYCVQWRIAERLHEMGRYKEAEEHYEIAFKRMPEQFGRVASFCFGCNGVFENEHSQSIAERILLRLVKTHPEKPQVYFLLGQLCQAQNKEAEAFEYYQKAVELDEKYLDAWDKLYTLGRTLFLPKHKLDEMMIHGLEIDPLQRHFSGQLDVVADIHSVWRTMANNQHIAVEDSHVEVELPAAKKSMAEAIEKMGAAEQDLGMMYDHYSYYDYTRLNPQRPGEFIAKHRVVQQLIQLLSY